ncbi:MAG TPA: PAS domain S-box protein [Candidatus Saccharimonadales bacterium]|nr:PAS domain S-box protein [Candidatus Saccharimonadales bacterium]
MKESTLSAPVRAILLAAAYVVGGWLGKDTSFMSGQVSLVWPPAGIALAAILLFGYRMWWGVALGAFLFTLVRGTPWGFFTLSTAVGNTVGAIVCAYLLERFVKFENSMVRLKHAIGFVILACLLGTTVNAAFNVLGLCYGGQVSWDDLFTNVIGWWVPNAMGALVVTPLILAWSSPETSTWRPHRVLEAVCCAAGLFIGTQLSFNSWFVYGVQNYPLAYLPYPFLVWGALRFGQRGATTGTFVVAGLAIYELLHRLGPFWTGNDQTSLMLIGCYIGAVAIGNLLLAAAAAERETALRATVASERRYRGVVEDQTDLICRFKPDGTLVFVNQAYCRFHARQKKDLIGSNFFATLPEQDREIPLGEFARLTRGKPLQSFDNRMLIENGQFLWQQCTVRALFDEEGHITEFQAVIEDITRRKQSEEALRLGEERLRAILNSLPSGVIVLDERGCAVLFNPAAEKIFHRKASEVLEHGISELFAPADRARYDDYLARHAGEDEARVIEVNALQPGGALAPIDMAVSEILRGGVLMIIVVVRDISQRKRLEEQYRQAQKMEAVGRLAGGIAHDFNNLMQAILGYIDLLDRRLPPGDPNHDAVTQIQKSLAHASSLTRQLLAFSRKQVLKPKLLSLNSVVADMNQLLQRVLGETIQLKMKLAAPVPWVRADPGQMEQLILNLAINARDAMPQGGSLSIETSYLEFQEETTLSSGRLPAGSYALLKISDTGSGMSLEVQAHLFEPFFTTKEAGKGTGLGLCNVYGVVKQSDGEITVDTEIGRGTAFNIYLPRLDGSVGEEESTQLVTTRTRGTETVLLVEDEELVRMMLVEVLKTDGYNVLDARHGADAIELAGQYAGPIDLLVTDMTMPGFNGSELARRLAVQRPAMCVLFISGYTERDTKQWAKLHQPVQFLQKPFHPDAFLSKTRQILDHVKKSADDKPAKPA